MYYKCNYCKSIKHFSNNTPNHTGHCAVCRCLRLFSLCNTPRDSSGSIHKPVARSSTSNFETCTYFRLCLQFMLSCAFSKRLFNRSQNRCYCKNCYNETKRNNYVQGGRRYVIPRGWVRFGVYIDDAQANAENIWNSWIVSYHGTSLVAAKSILEHHQFLLPGDKCIDGCVIKIRPNHIPGKFQVYTSASIAYSSLDVYCPYYKFRSSCGTSYRAQIVVQCRQQPGTFKIQAETVGAGTKRICPIISNDELEYFTDVRSSIIPYGLLIRVEKETAS